MKIPLKLSTIAFALLSPIVLYGQKPTLSCRPLPVSNAYVAPDEQIVGNEICKIVLSTPATASQSTEATAKPSNNVQSVLASEAPAAEPAQHSPAPVALAPSKTVTKPSKPRVYVSDSQSWVMSGGFAGGVSGNANSFSGASAGSFSGGSDPQTVEIIKNFMSKCPGVIVTRNRATADFAVLFDREGGKRGTSGWGGLLRKVDKIAVFRKNGDAIYSNSTRSIGSVVDDACSAIENSENDN